MLMDSGKENQAWPEEMGAKVVAVGQNNSALAQCRQGGFGGHQQWGTFLAPTPLPLPQGPCSLAAT